MKKALVTSIVAAGLLGMAGSTLAGDAVRAPILLTNAQMDQVVAGFNFQHTLVDVVETTSTEYYRGYSNKLAPGPGPGTSSAEVTTTTTTTTVMLCPGANVNSCGSTQTQVLDVTVNTSSSKGPLLSGPGRSFNNRF